MSGEKSDSKKKLPPGVRERNGRFTYRYSVEIIKDGRRIRKQKETKSYPTAKEAYEAGILIAADKLRGKMIDEKLVTLEQWCDQWLEDYKIEREPKIGTIEARENGLKSLKKHFGGHEKLRDITPRQYQGWLNSLKKRNFAKATVDSYHAAGRMLFAAAVRAKIISESPAAEARVPVYRQTLADVEQGNPLPRYLEQKELKHLLQIIRFRGRAQEHALFTLLAYTGMRIGEALGLKVSDFNEKERTLSIRRTLIMKGKITSYVLGTPKTTASVRDITIGETAIKAIKSQLAWREMITKEIGVVQKGDFLFWSPSLPGYPMSPRQAERRFEKLLPLAGLPAHLSPHTLRHTHVSLLAEAGESLTVIQERLGHQSDEITRLIYLHVTKERKKQTPDRFEAIMSK